MPKKTKPAAEKEPVKAPVVTEAVSQVVVAPEGTVAAETTVSETTTGEVKPAADAAPGSVVREGALASKIADLASVVEPMPETAVAAPNQPETATANELPQEEKPKPVKSGTGGIVWVVLAFLAGLAAGLVLGYVLWGRGSPVMTTSETEVKQPEKKQIATPSATPAPDSITETVKIDRKTLKIQVLNGSGGKGVAATARDFLLTLGYKNIDVGNAQTEDFQKTEVAVKKGKTDILSVLMADLADKYSVATASRDLVTSSEYDAVVTVGVK